MTVYAYCRVSSCSQSLSSQIDDIKKYGVEPDNIYKDVVSGVKETKKNFDKLMSVLEEGDTLVISRWDRISRSLQQLLTIVNDLTERGINLVSIHEKLDFSTPEGKLMLGMFGLMGEYFRNLQKIRQAEGIEACRARGKSVGGRPSLPKEKLDLAIDLYMKKEMTTQEIVNTVGISRSALYKEINARNIVRN